MSCTTCKAWLGLHRTHDGECPVRASAWCSQCGCYGHRPIECGEKIMWTRPRTLEELIPNDIRERWDITTQTVIPWSVPTLDDAEREIADVNSLEIRFKVGKMDGKIREFMKANRLVTAHKTQDNLIALRNWAVTQGKKIVLLQEK